MKEGFVHRVPEQLGIEKLPTMREIVLLRFFSESKERNEVVFGVQVMIKGASRIIISMRITAPYSSDDGNELVNRQESDGPGKRGKDASRAQEEESTLARSLSLFEAVEGKFECCI